MIFKVTHIDQSGHRRRARVTARSVADCMDQADREWGPARALACLRMAARPVLRLVPHTTDRRHPCA